MSTTNTQGQHVVTAVIVAHDGAAWLPRIAEALLGQTRPVQRVVAVDTGSRDRSGAVLAELLGRSVVFGMDRRTGYGAAIAHALRHRAANTNVPGPAGLAPGDRTEWVWLLHDDSEPAPDALEELLRGGAQVRSSAVLGPKVMDWADRRVLLEAGVTIDGAGRRITGVEPREVDQGQHDGDRDVMAVSSAGMLVRRDVWNQVGGFDPAMPLLRDDVDFCWRVHAAGHRVRVITDAVVYHLEATARNRRAPSAAPRPHRMDRHNALLTLLANLPLRPALSALAGNLVLSALRTVFFLLAKRPRAALDEFAGVTSVLGHPLQLAAARRRRARGRRAAYSLLRPDLPPGHSVRRFAEFAASVFYTSTQIDTAGSHHATDDPSDDDFMLVDNGLAQRILTHPGVLLVAGLTVIALIAERSLLGAGTLSGGALTPAWGGASALWHEYLQGFHPAGIGSASSTPPYVAIIAALATVLGGKPWLAIDVIMIGCIPLAGLAAFAALRRVTGSVLARVWAASAYALLPVAHGCGSGRAIRLGGGLRAYPADRPAGRPDLHRGPAPGAPGGMGDGPGGRDCGGLRAADLGRRRPRDLACGRRLPPGGPGLAAQPGHHGGGCPGLAAPMDLAGRHPAVPALSRGREQGPRAGHGRPARPVAAAALPGRPGPAAVLGDWRPGSRSAGRAAAHHQTPADHRGLVGGPARPGGLGAGEPDAADHG